MAVPRAPCRSVRGQAANGFVPTPSLVESTPHLATWRDEWSASSPCDECNTHVRHTCLTIGRASASHASAKTGPLWRCASVGRRFARGSFRRPRIAGQSLPFVALFVGKHLRNSDVARIGKRPRRHTREAVDEQPTVIYTSARGGFRSYHLFAAVPDGRDVAPVGLCASRGHQLRHEP